jgi:hypothetical protein
MQVKVLEEAGYESALFGLSLSFYDHKIEPFKLDNILTKVLHTSRLLTRHVDAPDTFWTDERYVRAEQRSKSLSGKGGGHDKFLRSIGVWLYIQAPRSFWSEFDTYQVGVTKNSSSTMHTLDKRSVTLDDFSVGTSLEAVEMFNNCLFEYKDSTSPYFKDITRLKENLPEGWLQERQIATNYAALQNIINQRYKHRLRYWRQFCTDIVAQVEHPELLKLPD